MTPEKTNEPAKGQPTESEGPNNIETLLADIEFPATREDLEQVARENQASEEVMEGLHKLPEREFKDSEDVTRAYTQH